MAATWGVGAMNRGLQYVAGGLGLLAVALSAAAEYMGLRVDAEDFLSGTIWGAAALVLVLCGVVIAIRRPRNVIGWLLIAAGMGEILAGTCNLYGQFRTTAGDHLPFAPVVGWVGGGLWVFSAACLLVFLPLHFPTGRPPTPRWRWVGWCGVACIVAMLLGTLDVLVFLPEVMGHPWEVIERASAGRPLFVLSELGFPLLMATAPIALLSLIVRFTRSTGEERQQIKLLIFAAAATVTFVVVVNVTDDVPRVAEALASGLALPSLGVATMAAVLRHGLFGIDRLISRTLTYGLLSVVLAGTYLAGLAVLTAATAPFAGDSAVAVAASTLLVAAAFQPARRRIQAVVDRRFNRARYDARHTVEGFATSLRQEVDIDDVQDQLLGTVDEVLQPAKVTLWLRPGTTTP